jgi:hypothetical protein
VAKILAIITLLVGFGSWVFACVSPLVLVQFDSVVSSALLGFLIIGGLGLGCLSVPVALVMGALVLTKYRKVVSGWDRAMVIVGVMAAAMFALVVVGLVVFVLLFPSAET